MARKPAPKEDAAPKASKPPNRVAKPPEPKAEILPAMTDALFEQICERVAGGSNLSELARESRFPSRFTIRKWIHASEERLGAYEAACKDRTAQRAEKIDEIVANVELGEIDPHSARVMIDAIKWQMSKEHPARYGDSSKIDLNVSRSLSDASDEELKAEYEKLIGEAHGIRRLTKSETA
jgi:hypothetical protein